MDNRCVICGEIIPEGREVCPNCEAGKIPEREYFTEEEAEQYHQDMIKLYKPIGINIFDAIRGNCDL